jgi:hypothetical protein
LFYLVSRPLVIWRATKVIELRFFRGLAETEAAEALEISIPTLKQDWDFVRSWCEQV